jgi:hypothetical protein
LVGQAHCGDDEGGVAGSGAEGDEENLVLVVMENGVKFGLEFAKAKFIEDAFEHGVLEADAVAFKEFGDAAEAFGVADVVADEVAGA